MVGVLGVGCLCAWVSVVTSVQIRVISTAARPVRKTQRLLLHHQDLAMEVSSPLPSLFPPFPCLSSFFSFAVPVASSVDSFPGVECFAPPPLARLLLPSPCRLVVRHGMSIATCCPVRRGVL